MASLQQAARGIKDGTCAFLFPEGTRSPEGTLLPFKKGGFKLAMQMGVPVVRVTIKNSRAVLPRNSIIFRRGTIEMYVDAPLPTAHLTDDDLPALVERTRRAMLNHLMETSGRD